MEKIPIVVGLDLSSSTGVAILDMSGRVLASQRIEVPVESDSPYPYNYLENATNLGIEILGYLENFLTLQIHTKLRKIVIEEVNLSRNRVSQKYVDFIHYSVLQSLIAYASMIEYIDTSEWRKLLNIKLTEEDRKNNKLVKAKQKKGKITPKHLSVRYVNGHYGLSLLQKDNDIADAICQARAWLVKHKMIS